MAVLIATAGGAGAATTIGQLAPPNPPAFCTLGPFDVVQPTVISGNSYVVPSDGVLTSWSHNAAAGAGQTLTMKVFRKVADPNTYQSSATTARARWTRAPSTRSRPVSR